MITACGLLVTKVASVCGLFWPPGLLMLDSVVLYQAALGAKPSDW